MKITCDSEADAMYIYLRVIAAGGVGETRELGDDVMADYGPGGELLGIEILDASRRLGEDPPGLVFEVYPAGTGREGDGQQ
jgi:uncharacterized protein YuzE